MILNKLGSSTPFLFTGSTYMKEDIEECFDSLGALNMRFKGNYVIPESLRPLIIGIVGWQEDIDRASEMLEYMRHQYVALEQVQSGNFSGIDLTKTVLIMKIPVEEIYLSKGETKTFSKEDFL